MSRVFNVVYGAKVELDLLKRFEEKLDKLSFQKAFVLRYLCDEFRKGNIEFTDDLLVFKAKYIVKNDNKKQISFHLSRETADGFDSKAVSLSMKKTDVIVYLIAKFTDGNLKVKNDLFGE